MSKPSSELAHLFRTLKMPAAARSLGAIADRAREEGWSYERFAEVLLGTEVSSRDSHGGEGRIKAARSLKGDSYRLRGKDLDTRIGAKPAEIG